MDILGNKKFHQIWIFFYYSFRVDLLIKHNIDPIRPICSDLITSLKFVFELVRDNSRHRKCDILVKLGELDDNDAGAYL